MKENRKRIERAYTRAMNIRDSSSVSVATRVEDRYGRSYRRAYRNSDAEWFTSETRLYLQETRKVNLPLQIRKCGHKTRGGCKSCKRCFACCNEVNQ